MATRKGSAGKSVPHTRIEEESGIWKLYEPGVMIGQGTFGKVFKVKHKETDVFWAMKVVNKEKAGTSAVKLLEREVTILKRVDHENIISLNEVFETAKKMYLIMELCEMGELADAVKTRNNFPEAEVKVIVQQAASAIAYLHKKDIVHRDLKLENILLSQNPDDPDDQLHIKVTDFGLSVVKSGVGHDNMIQDFCGTPIYMSPEIIDNKTYSQQCDVWALGVIVYILLTGTPPFKSKDEETLYDLIKRGEIDTENEIWSEISPEARDAIQKMLKVDPAHRLTASEVLNHKWLTGESRESTNVLEMMKLWKDDLKKEEGQESAINGEYETDDIDGVGESSSITNKVETNGKPSSDGNVKGQVKKPGSGGKSGRTSNQQSTKTGLAPPPLRNAGAKSPSLSKNVNNSKGVNNNVNRTAPPQSTKGRGVKK